MMLGVLGAKGQWYIGVPICTVLFVIGLIVLFSMNSGLASWEKYIPLRAANQARTREDMLLAQLRKGISGVGGDSDILNMKARAKAEVTAPLLPTGSGQQNSDLALDVPPASSDQTPAPILPDAVPTLTDKSTFPGMSGDTGKDALNVFKYFVTGSAGSGLLSEDAMKGYSDKLIEFVKPLTKNYQPEVPHELRTGSMTARGKTLTKEYIDSFQYEYAMEMDIDGDGKNDMDEEGADDAIFVPDKGGFTGYYLEPDTWRMAGVLDPITPLKGSYNHYRIAEEDPQNYVYAHPALVGPMPQIWLPSRKHTIDISDVRKRYVIKKTEEERRKSAELRREDKEVQWVKKLPPTLRLWWSDVEAAWGAFGTSIAFSFR
jgi:hypothetical protein